MRIMKIKAKVAYKDDTHRRIMDTYNTERKVYQKWIDEENHDMIDYSYARLKAYAWALVMADCIELEHYCYLEKELDEARGWTF